MEFTAFAARVDSLRQVFNKLLVKLTACERSVQLSGVHTDDACLVVLREGRFAYCDIVPGN